MNNTQEKIIKKLDELIKEIPELKNKQYNSDEADLWKKRTKKLMERIGGEDLESKFIGAGAFAHSMHADEREIQEYYLKQLKSWNNFLIVLKEDMEMFDEKDEPNYIVFKRTAMRHVQIIEQKEEPSSATDTPAEETESGTEKLQEDKPALESSKEANPA